MATPPVPRDIGAAKAFVLQKPRVERLANVLGGEVDERAVFEERHAEPGLGRESHQTVEPMTHISRSVSVSESMRKFGMGEGLHLSARIPTHPAQALGHPRNYPGMGSSVG